ncbi:endolytic transglycosylase MltG [Sedimentibacter sp. MB31-C6]|uniref:endolytic transglycosylase MltG n=1 Tax=Sedimentibacter sp. MB31-C6 TaxID=3109366 RepID=UPI002DDD684D|nr:endolytic transglycosylase MltG [Sedimentibacter sp. MB36-C1]WSI04421.1 endolytic transglycosylase MltG [Sedimentibacter sp. MB36-C1]
MKKIITFLVILVVIIGSYIIVNNYIDANLQAVDSNDNAKIIVEIPQGSSTSGIAEILYDNNLIRDKRIFKYYANKTGADSKLKAGDYVLSREMNVDKILEELIKGGISGNTANITIIEGLTIEDTAMSISEQLGLNFDELVNIMEHGEMFNDEFQFMLDNQDITNLQGYLMPDTYNVYVNFSEEDIVRFLLSQFDSFYLEEIKPLLENSKLNFEETINLASIVEKEALLDEERDEVAATFLNRLDINMKLQSCATVNYALGEWKEYLTLEDIAVDSPFNTYLLEGLPPTPINSPGKISIKAVLEPAEVDYLYFVAKGDGTHHFSNNYDDHLAAKDKYMQ